MRWEAIAIKTCSHNHSPAVPIITVQHSRLTCYVVAYSKLAEILIITYEFMLLSMKFGVQGEESGRDTLEVWRSLFEFESQEGLLGSQAVRVPALQSHTLGASFLYEDKTKIKENKAKMSRVIYSILSIWGPFKRLFGVSGSHWKIPVQCAS